MKITFLVGNGFDMRMGIASSYKSVEKHYIRITKKDKTLQEFQQSLKENGQYWSDFEIAIGKYTSHFNNEDQRKFILCLDDFTIELEKYLMSEEERVDFSLCAKDIKENFVRSITSYDGELERKYRNQLNSILANSDTVVFKFISFNYTHLLDKCLELSFDEKSTVGSHVRSGTRYNHTVDNRVIHIHGELPGPIIMGVDNPSQIENEAWSKQKRFLQSIAKPSMNSRAGSLVDNEATDIINQSSIICVFGMSLGDTDKTWWKLIGKWLVSSDHRLIIFGHNSELTVMELTHQRRFILEDELKDRFMDLAEISNSERAVIEDRIFVYINSSLFNTNLVNLTEQKKSAEGHRAETDISKFKATYEDQTQTELATIT